MDELNDLKEIMELDKTGGAGRAGGAGRTGGTESLNNFGKDKKYQIGPIYFLE